MALSMARPWQDPRTHVWYLRQRTPLDLLSKLKGRSVTLPIGDAFAAVKIGPVVQASLRTADRHRAKELHAAADAALRRFWEAHRKGPVHLTHKQAVALAGTAYRALMDEWQDDPVDPVHWQRAVEENREALDGSGAAQPDTSGRLERLEEAHGFHLDHLLDQEGLVIDAASRGKVLLALAVAIESAALQLKRNAEGDYRPDPAADSFPAWVPPKAAGTKPSERLTVARLVEAWTAFQAGKLAPNTIKRYAASLRSLAAFTGEREAGKLTGDDVHDWAVHRRDKDGIAARVINKNDLVAASSAFKWAMGREAGRLVHGNPVTGVSLTEDAAVQVRAKTFRPGEATAILKAALAEPDDPKNPTSAFARRWCPWLAAYSGARITELTGLTGADVRMEDGHPVMAFTKTKTGIPRTVPLHPHLIELGFLAFVKERGPGPLFLDPKRHGKGAVTDPAEMRSRKIAQWVRDTVNLDAAVQPDHGWRHTWKTKALEVGIPERISDAITGHRVRSVARAYETPTVGMMAEALKRFPRYEIEGGKG